MPLPLPDLDDRSWQDLVEEGRARIPRHAPDWTDHNVHDPGVTMLELWAWLSEATAYRINRVPARHLAKFLALAGFRQRPPRGSHLFLSFSQGPFPANPDGFPAGAVLETAVDGVALRTLRNLQLVDAELVAVQIEEITEAGSEFRDRTRSWREGTPFEAFGAAPRIGASLYLGFSSLPDSQRLSIGFSIDGSDDPRAEREALLDDARRRRAFCRQPLPDIACEGAEEPVEEEVSLPLHHSAVVEWELFTGDPQEPWTRLAAASGAPQPGEAADGTRSLTSSGVVEVQVPPGAVATSLGAVADPLLYLRLRLAAGDFDAPPSLRGVALNSVAVEQAVPVFETFPIQVGTVAGGPDPAPGLEVGLGLDLTSDGEITSLEFGEAEPGAAIRVLEYEAATATDPGALTLELRRIGTGSGRPEQRIGGLEAKIEADGLRLFTLEAGRLTGWIAVSDFDASKRVDRHFTLDPEAGEIRFGDGESGRLPGAGTPLFASWRRTLGAAGNLAAGRSASLVDSPHNDLWLGAFAAADREALLALAATNPASGVGGRDLEDLEAVLGRAFETQHAHQRLLELCARERCSTLDQIARPKVEEIRPPSRAVNLLDLERLTLTTPGTRIARARAWPAVHPDFGCLRADGVVTVLVVPDKEGPRPLPSPGLLETVRCFLDRHRMVTTRIEVAAPEYVEVRVDARVVLCSHTDPARVRSEIARRLDDFFDPRRGGPRGFGWPFGRDVIRSEIMQLIDEVEGVDFVLELRLSADSAEPTCGNIALCPTQLVLSGEHRLRIEEPGNE